jgi:NAD+ kinase
VTEQQAFRRIALVVHPTRPVDGALATLTGWTRGHGLELVQLATRAETVRRVAEMVDVAPDDLVVALGGDGTVLSALRVAAEANAPVLGVACGSVGALSVVTPDELGGALDRIRAGDWTPRSLPALAVAAAEGDGDRAFNDFVVVRRRAGQLAVDVSVDGERYVRLSGDGLIVSTALGSSAYSMAAGGPLLAAGTPAFVCTPLAMHGGSAPPLVVPADAVLTVEARPGYAGFVVEIDGFRTLPGARSFRLTLQPDVVRLITFGTPSRGVAGLRRRRLITDSPRVLARDDRTAAAAPLEAAGGQPARRNP